MTSQEIAKKAFNSTVMLLMQGSDGSSISLGSGFFVTSNQIATNLHVVKDAISGYAKIVGYEEKFIVEGITAIDSDNDLVILKISGTNAKPLVLENSDSVQVGDTIYAVGNPEGLEGTFSQGIISGIRGAENEKIFQITAPISQGSSGGPVLDTNGKVIGVSMASIQTGQNLNFAIPSNYLKLLFDRIGPLKPFPKINPLKHLSPEQLNQKAIEIWNNGRYSELNLALQYLNEAIMKNPSYGRAYYTRGFIYIDLERYEEAIDSYTEALKYDPDTPETYNGRGWVYATLGDYDRAIKDYTNAIRVKPDYILALNNRGVAYFAKGQNEMGCTDFIRACELGECELLRRARRIGLCR